MVTLPDPDAGAAWGEPVWAGSGLGLDPVLTLAHTMHATPGSHAVLMGAGASMAAGMPSAWQVQVQLIDQLARQLGEPVPGDAESWFVDRFGLPPRYEVLLEQLAPAPLERQRLLRRFFEPNEQERDQGVKQPSDAHRALARLVAVGAVQIVLTTNFDRLIETALRQLGIEPTVVTTPDLLTGLAPLHTQEALVVHLHGDYLTPTGMLNTEDELGSYLPEVDAFLNRVLEDRGLLVVGWSATYDPALRSAISRQRSRIFTSYWVDPADLSPVASDLRSARSMVGVRSTANEALSVLADAVQALSDRRARHPLSLPVAVATAKRELAGRTTALGLHDLLRDELARVHRLPELNMADDFALPAGTRVPTLRERIQEGLRVAGGLVATAAYWGRLETDAWWFGEIERFARQRHHGLAGASRVAYLPATHLLYSAGVAAIAAERFDLAHRLLTGPRIRNHFARPETVAECYTPGTVMPDVDLPSLHLMRSMAEVFVTHLALGQETYEDAWEHFELLRLTQVLFSHSQAPQRIDAALRAKDRYAVAHFDLQGAQQRQVQSSPEDAALQAAWEERGRALGHLADLAFVEEVHLRVEDTRQDGLPSYLPVVGRDLVDELEQDGPRHPLVTAGFGGGDINALTVTVEAVNLAVARKARDVASAMVGMSGVVPSYLWLDTKEHPAR